MPIGPPPVVQQLTGAKSNRFLAALPRDAFALLSPHLRAVTLQRGVIRQHSVSTAASLSGLFNRGWRQAACLALSRSSCQFHGRSSSSL
jgi:hypothetical protein